MVRSELLGRCRRPFYLDGDVRVVYRRVLSGQKGSRRVGWGGGVLFVRKALFEQSPESRTACGNENCNESQARTLKRKVRDLLGPFERLLVISRTLHSVADGTSPVAFEKALLYACTILRWSEAQSEILGIRGVIGGFRSSHGKSVPQNFQDAPLFCCQIKVVGNGNVVGCNADCKSPRLFLGVARNLI